MIDFEKIKTSTINGTFRTIATMLRGDLIEFWSDYYKIDKTKYNNAEELRTEVMKVMEEDINNLEKELSTDNNSKYTDDTMIVQICTYPTIATSVSFNDNIENLLSSLSIQDFEKIKEILKNNGGEIVEEYGNYGFKYIRRFDAPEIKELAIKLRKLKTLKNDMDRIINGKEKEEKSENEKNNDKDLLKEAVNRLKNK